jgi:hypothetical protein
MDLYGHLTLYYSNFLYIFVLYDYSGLTFPMR